MLNGIGWTFTDDGMADTALTARIGHGDAESCFSKISLNSPSVNRLHFTLWLGPR